MITDDDFHSGIPSFLDRKLHPELVPSPEKLKAALETELLKRKEQAIELEQQRIVDRIKRRLAAIVKHGEPEEGSVSSKIAQAYRNKLARLGGQP